MIAEEIPDHSPQGDIIVTTSRRTAQGLHTDITITTAIGPTPRLNQISRSFHLTHSLLLNTIMMFTGHYLPCT